MTPYKPMMWIHQTSSRMPRLAYCTNEPMLLKLVSAIMDLSANVSISLLPKIDYYRACVGVTSNTIIV